MKRGWSAINSGNVAEAAQRFNQAFLLAPEQSAVYHGYAAVVQIRFNDLANAKITAHRDLYFSEYFSQQSQRGHTPIHKPEQEAVNFFITVDGQKEVAFDPNNPPANCPPLAPCTLQPSNAALLNALAADFVASGYDLQALTKEIINSQTYQLSSRYNGTWDSTTASAAPTIRIIRPSSVMAPPLEGTPPRVT